MSFAVNPIKFGTDGWRGVIAADFTFERVAKLAPLAASVLANNYPQTPNNKLIIVGYDRRFMAEDFAKVAAVAIQSAGFDVLLANSYAPTPAFSWAAFKMQALGAIVMTASHNPPNYLGLKVKGAFGGSVPAQVTQQIEALLPETLPPASRVGSLDVFDPWASYCEELRSKVDVEAIKGAIASGKLQVYADVMHGAASTGLERVLGCQIQEINSNRDVLFGGHPPEPLAQYTPELLATIKAASKEAIKVGLVFDGDADRIAAVDGEGNFLSSQILVPILIDHLSQRKGWTGEIVKTVSGSDLIPLLSEIYQIPLYETPVGYKYIAERMLTHKVLIGGEESGGIGYGSHIPERDALLSALYVLEAVVESGKDLGVYYQQLLDKAGFSSSYDRLDLPLASMEVRDQVVQTLKNQPPTEIAGQKVTDCLAIDGYKFRLADQSWLMIRFSGTEPLLRLYSEATNLEDVHQRLNWARDWANSL